MLIRNKIYKRNNKTILRLREYLCNVVVQMKYLNLLMGLMGGKREIAM